jgi:hypothetical protein
MQTGYGLKSLNARQFTFKRALIAKGMFENDFNRAVRSKSAARKPNLTVAAAGN